MLPLLFYTHVKFDPMPQVEVGKRNVNTSYCQREPRTRLYYCPARVVFNPFDI